MAPRAAGNACGLTVSPLGNWTTACLARARSCSPAAIRRSATALRQVTANCCRAPPRRQYRLSRRDVRTSRPVNFMLYRRKLRSRVRGGTDRLPGFATPVGSNGVFQCARTEVKRNCRIDGRQGSRPVSALVRRNAPPWHRVSLRTQHRQRRPLNRLASGRVRHRKQCYEELVVGQDR